MGQFGPTQFYLLSIMQPSRPSRLSKPSRTSSSGKVNIQIDGETVKIEDTRSFPIFKDAFKVTIPASEYDEWKIHGWKNDKDILSESTKKIEEAKQNNKRI